MISTLHTRKPRHTWPSDKIKTKLLGAAWDTLDQTLLYEEVGRK